MHKTTNTTIEKIKAWNTNNLPYPEGVLIHELFEQQANLTPTLCAVRYNGYSLSYEELNQKANSLAHHLKELGIKPGAFVGIYLDYSINIVVSLLAILKTGAAYIPLDTYYPDDRVNYMLENANVTVVLTTSSSKNKFSENFTCIRVDEVNFPSPCNNLNVTHEENHPIYILYTSGSTGKPKGALLYHKGVSNLLNFYIQKYGLTSKDKVLIISSFSFDLTHKNILSALLVGAEVHLIDIKPFDPRYIVTYIQENNITFFNCTPSAFYPLLEEASNNELASLRWIFLGGEFIDTKVLKRFKKNLCESTIVNTYGPTECSDLICTYALTDADIENTEHVPVGSLLQNTRLIILDENNQPVEPGEAGEIYIGGAGVGGGYFNNPSQTAEKFVTNPLQNTLPELGPTLYKTGDYGTWLENGLVKCLGRIDEQIKLNGQRIEIEEIENVLASHSSVKQAVVTVNKDSSNFSKLEAFLIIQPGESLQINTIKALIEKQLPSYMIPVNFFQVSHFPINPNGKLDRQELKKISQQYAKPKKIKKPKNYIEQTLLEIWSELLRIKSNEVSVTDIFFEAGGYSLLATRLNLRIKRLLNVNLPIKVLFENPTIEKLAKTISQETIDKFIELKNINKLYKTEAPLTPSQERIFFLSKLLPSSGFYNLPIAFKIEGDLNIEALESSIASILNKHKVLTSKFKTSSRGSTQRIVQHFVLEKILKVHDQTHLPSVEAINAAQTLLNQDANLAFNLENDFPIRIKLIKLNRDESILYFNIHHIVFDGTSWPIFKSELSLLYNSYNANQTKSFEPLKIDFLDYAYWYQENSEKFENHKSRDFWLGLLSGGSFPLFPTDQKRTAQPDYTGKRKKHILPEKIKNILSKTASKYSVSYFSILISIFSKILMRYSGRDSEYISIPFANRPLEQTEEIIGCFINTIILPLRINQETLRDTIQSNSKLLAEALEHQHYPFEKLVDALNIDRDIRVNPISQIMFAFQNADEFSLTMDDLQTSSFELDTLYSRFDIEWHVLYENGALVFDIFFKHNLFKDETIRGFIEFFETVLLNLDKELNSKSNQFITVKNKLAKLSHCEGVITNIPFNSVVNIIEKNLSASTAIHYENKNYSYAHLNNESNQLANYLIQKGIKKGDIIAISMDLSYDTVIVMLAILKVGAIFLPLNTKHPEKYQQNIIDDTGITSIFFQNENQSFSITNAKSAVFLFNQIRGDVTTVTQEKPDIKILPEDPAYLIYTSGTSGKPKGVLIKHKSLANLLTSFSDAIRFNKEDNLLAITAISFDISLLEIFMPLINGASITILNNKYIDPEYISNTINQNKNITTIQATPKLWNLLLNANIRLGASHKIISGGEELTFKLAQKLLRTGAQLWNAYGPTETTIWSLISKLDSNDSLIPLGNPIANTKCFVVNEQGKTLPAGVAGELLIAGDGLAHEYWNLPELTKNKFNLFKTPQGELVRSYRTGDIFVMHTDEKIYFQGRKDDQIKINGHRVELNEIKETLSDHPLVEESHLLSQTDNGNVVTHAFIKIIAESMFKEIDNLYIQRWQSVFHDLYQYGNSEAFPGWNDSETRTPIPEVEMLDWLESSLTHLKPYIKSNIIEIGSGNGLLVTKLIDDCISYCATEFSRSAIGILKNKFLNNVKVSLIEAAAHQVNDYSHFNLVIANSVIQYFPSINYLEEFINTASSGLPENSSIYLGDVCSTLSNSSRQNTNELLVNPIYFGDLKRNNSNIHHIEILPKLSKFPNEMSLHRYDVILHIKTTNDSFDFDTTSYLENKNLKLICSETIPYKNPNYNTLISSEIMRHLASKLPSYMLPNEIHLVESFPISLNGKIDRDKLFSQVSNAHKEPETSLKNIDPDFELLEKTWCKFLKITHLSRDDDFFALGGNSFLAVQLNHEVNNVFKINLPLADFYTNPVFENQLKEIHHLAKRENAPLLADIETQGNKPIVFILPPVDGSSSWYSELISKLRDKFICVALSQEELINPNHAKFIEKQAELYVSEILRIQPDGVYRILGWSFGGIMAYEIAMQLNEMQKETVTPILIDAPPPQNKKMIANAHSLLEGIQNKWITLNNNAYIHYFPLSKLPGIVWIGTEECPRQEWENYCDSLTTHIIHEAQHYTIMKDHFVNVLANLIKAKSITLGSHAMEPI